MTLKSKTGLLAGLCSAALVATLVACGSGSNSKKLDPAPQQTAVGTGLAAQEQKKPEQKAVVTPKNQMLNTLENQILGK